MEKDDSAVSSPAGCLVRLFWFFGGNILLVFLLISIFNRRSFTISDLGFWIVVACLIISRYVDIRYLKGQTAEGAPATMNHWRKYSAMLLAISVGVWGLTHIIGRIWG
jgi:hypothetical protein